MNGTCGKRADRKKTTGSGGLGLVKLVSFTGRSTEWRWDVRKEARMAECFRN